MKLHQSRVLSGLSRFALDDTTKKIMREVNDIFLMWKVCEYFQPKSVLEIGFFAGQTLGQILEANDSYNKIISVDINYLYRPVFQEVFKDDPRVQQIEFIETDSMNLNLEGLFDFIHIDGDHNYEYVLNDVTKSLTLMHKNTILCMDDYPTEGVMQVIKEQLLGQHDFVPFLSGDQEMFFHHISHSADEFLDRWIQVGAENFIHFSNYDFHGFTVLRAQTPKIFEENRSMFQQALQFYNL
jgi:predicted O-methyltransferase YrrM